MPGSTATYDLRAQDVHGAFGRPMLSLLQGHYPAGPGQVAVTPGVARQFDLAVGHVWHQGGVTRTVTGIVQNPQSLLDEFALLGPGQVHAPTSVTVLFDAPSVPAGQIGPNVVTPQTTAANAINPDTIVLTLATVGMLLIALVSVGGFTVLAQRRLRALGMLAAIGATDRNVRLVVRANGLVVGVAGTLLGAVLGLAAWLAYRPRVVEQLASRDRPVRVAVGRDRPGHGPGRAGHLPGCLAAGPGGDQDPGGGGAGRAARPRRSVSTGRPCPVWSCWRWRSAC